MSISGFKALFRDQGLKMVHAVIQWTQQFQFLNRYTATVDINELPLNSAYDHMIEYHAEQ